MGSHSFSLRDKIFWTCVGVISILSVYLVSNYLIDQQSDYSGFIEHRYKNRYSIMTPPYLQPDDSLHKEAILQFSDYSNEVYLLVLQESKKDLERRDIRPVLTEYFNYIEENIIEGLDVYEVNSIKDHYIDKMHVITGEIDGSYAGVHLYYIFSVYESETAFFQVRGWSSAAAKPEVKNDLYGSIQSFRVLHDYGK
jgi:hypothetical protein